jgi:hypothetical protein
MQSPMALLRSWLRTLKEANSLGIVTHSSGMLTMTFMDGIAGQRLATTAFPDITDLTDIIDLIDGPT